MIHGKLDEIAKRWGFESLQNELRTVAEDVRVTVGFVGDFSSGKSTLINALVGQEDLMPTSVEPTTASAGLALSVEGLLEPAYFRLLPDGTEESISRVEVDDVARARIPGRPVVHVPPTPGFPAHTGFADTPGLGSMDESHYAELLRELPYMDAALVCLDLQKGNMTASVSAFLQSPGVRHLRHRFLFALTHADRKPAIEGEAIRDSFVRELVHLEGLTTEQAADRIALAAAGPEARRRGKEDLVKVQAMLDRFISGRRGTLLRERRFRAAERLVPLASSLLRERRAALVAPPEELLRRRRELEEQVEEIQRTRSEHEVRLRQFESALRMELEETCARHKAALAAAKTSDEVRAAHLSLANALTPAISRSVGHFAADFSTFTAAGDSELAVMLDRVNRIADVGKNVATATVTAVLLPNPAGAAGAAANTWQAGGGAAVHVAGTTATKAAASGGLRGAALTVLRALDDLNPVNTAGDLIAQAYKQSALDGPLRDFAQNVAAQAAQDLRRLYAAQHFDPLDGSLRDVRASLQQAAEERKRGAEDQRLQLARLDADLSTLQSLVPAEANAGR